MKHDKVRAALADEFVKAKRGEHIVYHNGLLMRDRQVHQHVHTRANLAYDLFVAGRCSLVQERLRDGTCAYIMQKIR